MHVLIEDSSINSPRFACRQEAARKKCSSSTQREFFFEVIRSLFCKHVHTMASDVPSHLRFDFESEMPDVNSTPSLGGGGGDLRPAVELEQDTHIADADDDIDLLDPSSFVDMHDLERVISWVAALEAPLQSVNTNLTNYEHAFSTIFSTFCTTLNLDRRQSGGPIPIVPPPLAPPSSSTCCTLRNPGRGHVEKHEAACV